MRRTQPLSGWLFTSKHELHRTARMEPTFLNTRVVFFICAFSIGLNVSFYFGTRLLQWYRGKKDLILSAELDSLVFTRPDLSVALLKMNLHYIMSETSSPFGAPMVAPPTLKPEAEELARFVREKHIEHPHCSVPDMWVMLTRKASLRLGGPDIRITSGRKWPKYDEWERHNATEQSGSSSKSYSEDTTNHNHHDANRDVPFCEEPALVRIVSAAVADTERDIGRLKQVCASQGLSTQEIVALVGAIRNVGFHGGAEIHNSIVVKPTAEQLRGDVTKDVLQLMPEALAAPKSNRKCSVDPYAFDGVYFTHLLDYKWEPVTDDTGEAPDTSKKPSRRRWFGILSAVEPTAPNAPMLFKCDEDRRRRSKQTLVDPYSVENLKRPSTIITTEEGKRELTRDELSIEEQEVKSEVDFCSNIRMEPIDVSLMDDAMCVGWIARLSNDETQFYSVVATLLQKIHERGYNKNLLERVITSEFY
jgi:hypothetical protein